MESPYPNGSLHPGGGTSVAGGGGGGAVLQPEHHLPCPVFTANACSSLESIQLGGDVFLDQYRDVDVSSEWLSNFVEECLSSAGNYSCLPVPAPPTAVTDTPADSSKKTTQQNSGLPRKPRSQRKRRLPTSNTSFTKTTATKVQFNKNPYLIRPWPHHNNNNNHLHELPFQLGFSDPPLLEQAYWLADSELIHPLKKTDDDIKEVSKNKTEEMVQQQVQQQQQPARRCSHCQAQKTPQWRAGPLGPKTLCNACGVRYFKSGKLLPEYRPAKSPTFISYKHSNSHKKVLQMRMAFHSSSSSSSSSSLDSNSDL